MNEYGFLMKRKPYPSKRMFMERTMKEVFYAKTNSGSTTLFGVSDDLDPEVRAMLLALYSRSSKTVVSHLPKNEEEALTLKKKLSRYYLGYNHKAVGQLACVDVFFEKVSILAAASLEHNKIINCQECSTRYIDFKDQGYVVPDVEYAPIIDKLIADYLALYVKWLGPTRDLVAMRFPEKNYVNDPGFTKERYNNAINAKAFDICRGVLTPAMRTNVGISTTFDAFNDHFRNLAIHPTLECREIAVSSSQGFSSVYEYGGQRHDLAALGQALPREQASKLYYLQHLDQYLAKEHSVVTTKAYLNKEALEAGVYNLEAVWEYREISTHAPITLRGYLDYGSARDLHRHRDADMPMPLITYDGPGFDQFYTRSMPHEMLVELGKLLDHARTAYMTVRNNSNYDPEQVDIDFQYACPMGLRVPILFKTHPSHLKYVGQLRTAMTVHQSLREFMIRGLRDMNQALYHSDGQAFPFCTDDEDLSIKRGSQTFKI